MNYKNNNSKGFNPISSGPNMTGYYLGEKPNLMSMMQQGGGVGGAYLARALQQKKDTDRLERAQAKEAKRQKRGSLWGSVGGLGLGLLGAALAPATGGLSLALASGAGTALGKYAGSKLGAGKSADVDTSGTVYGQQSFRDVEQAGKDYNKNIAKDALVSGLKAGATAGLAPGGGMYGKVGGKLATAQSRQALKEAIPMMINQAPSNIASLFKGAPVSGAPVIPKVDNTALLGDLLSGSSFNRANPMNVNPLSVGDLKAFTAPAQGSGGYRLFSSNPIPMPLY